MNPFIEQFLIEGRELVEQAVNDLLALETRPGAVAHLDGVFRAVHTLKGAAGIIDFAAMARGLHAVEDALSAAHAGARPLTPALISDCLSALDQVVRWLDAIEASGGEPPGDADAGADAMEARFGREPAAVAAIPRPVLDGAAIVDADQAVPDLTALCREILEAQHLMLDVSEPRGLPGHLTSAGRVVANVLRQIGRAPATGETLEGVEAAGDPVPLITTIRTIVAGMSPGAGPDAAVEAAADVADGTRPAQVSAQEGAAQEVSAQGGAAQEVSAQGGAAQEVSAQEGAAQEVSAQEGAAQEGAAQEGAAQEGAAQEVAAREGAAQEVAARALRVDVERIDTLVRLAGELTVIKSAIGLLCGPSETAADSAELVARLKDQHGQLDRLTTDLRHAVLRIRVLPLRDVFQRFPRVVRDLGSSLGKPIRLITEGDDTEADKEIVESLFEPLLHVLRNAADHGLEDASGRVAAGKPALGTIRLRADRSGEQVIVEIEDDGRGIDVDRIRVLAERRGVANAATLAAMSQAEIVELIFTPSFSTATRVTTVSGRGVGMDAVRTAVGRLGGSVGVESRPGQGTTVRFVLPFTLLITWIITVEAGGQMFGIPLDRVIETVRIGKGQIMAVGAARAFTLRDRIVPLFNLAAIVGADPERPCADDVVVVVIAMGGDLAGLVVERLGERIDAMLKPMEGLLSGTAGIAGTTLLGDGRVLIVLDVQELLR